MIHRWRFFKYMFLCSSDRDVSLVRAFFKSLYCAFLLPVRVSPVGDINASGRYLVCLKKSYESKSYIYDQIAHRLNASIFIVSMGRPFSSGCKKDFFLINAKIVFVWSDVQIKATAFIYHFLGQNVSYRVYQHGAYPTQYQLGAIAKEWDSTRAKHYYAWGDEDVNMVVKSRPDLCVSGIGVPDERPRSIVNGVGFGTRGPEFIKEDMAALLLKCQGIRDIFIYFHPSYGYIKKTWFLLSIFARGIKGKLGDQYSITSVVFTYSRSFEDVARSSGVQDIRH